MYSNWSNLKHYLKRNPMLTMNNSCPRYYGLLSKKKIVELYEMYKLDHLIFGYLPDKYLSWGY